MERLYKISKIEGIFLFDKSLANSILLGIMYQQFDAPLPNLENLITSLTYVDALHSKHFSIQDQRISGNFFSFFRGASFWVSQTLAVYSFQK